MQKPNAQGLGLERRRVRHSLATDRDKENLANHLGATSIVSTDVVRGDDCYWHLADIDFVRSDVRY
jgi:hypothetical protein